MSDKTVVTKLQTQEGFAAWRIKIVLISMLGNFFFANLSSDMLNLHYSYICDVWGWARTFVSWPGTIASLIGIPFSYVLGTMTGKYGGRRIATPTFMTLGLATICIGISAANGSYPLYFAARLLSTISMNAMYVAIYAITNNWFISTRGRILGFVTCANAMSPIAINLITRIVVATQNFPLANYCYGGVLIVVGLLTFVLTRDKPEDVGLLPDGLVRTEEEIAVMAAKDPNEWSNKRLLHTKEAWLLGIAVACCQLNMGGFMSIFIPRMLELNINIITAVNYMSAVSLIAIALSVLWGVIDDKFGTPRAATILGCGYVLANVSMLLAGVTKSTVFVMLAVFFAASMVGGLPNLHPSLYAFVFGRKQFTYVERSIGVVRSLIMAPISLLWNYIYVWTGTYQAVYIVCGVLALIATICYASVRKTYDPERLNLKGVVNFK